MLESVCYNVWLKKHFPVLVDGMVHVIDGTSAHIFAHLIIPETSKIMTIDCIPTTNFQWLQEQLNETTIASMVMHLVICIDLPLTITTEQAAN